MSYIQTDLDTPKIKEVLTNGKTTIRKPMDSKYLIQGEPKFSTRNARVTNTCPYGKVGDLLWVRESYNSEFGVILYKADFSEEEGRDLTWIPHSCMPMSASRLFLKVVEIGIGKDLDLDEFYWTLEVELVDRYKIHQGYISDALMEGALRGIVIMILQTALAICILISFGCNLNIPVTQAQGVVGSILLSIFTVYLIKTSN